MNMAKINQEALKRLEKIVLKGYPARELFIAARDETNGNIYLIFDGTRVYKLTENLVFVDVTKADTMPIESVERIFNDGLHVDARFNGEIREILKDKKVVRARKLVAENGAFAWVNEKFFDLFDKDATFKIKNETGTVVVYESGEKCGLVLPIRVKD